EAGADPRLERTQRLLELDRRFGVRQACEERHLDGVALLVREHRQRRPQPMRLLLELERVIWPRAYLVSVRLVGARIDALLPLVEAQAVDGTRPRLVHDPPDHQTVRRVVRGRTSPNVVENIQRQLLGRLAISSDTHDQGEDNLMRAAIQTVQRSFVARCYLAHQFDPLTLRGG